MIILVKETFNVANNCDLCFSFLISFSANFSDWFRNNVFFIIALLLYDVLRSKQNDSNRSTSVTCSRVYTRVSRMLLKCNKLRRMRNQFDRSDFPWKMIIVHAHTYMHAHTTHTYTHVRKIRNIDFSQMATLSLLNSVFPSSNSGGREKTAEEI